MSKKVIYQLIEDDVHHVSKESIGRKLNNEEIKKIQDLIDKRINWFEIIESSIDELDLTPV